MTDSLNIFSSASCALRGWHDLTYIVNILGSAEVMGSMGEGNTRSESVAFCTASRTSLWLRVVFPLLADADFPPFAISADAL
jgi:hypothetical protein